MAGARPSRSFEDLDELLRHARPPTTDDVSITMDGRRLDTSEKVFAFLAEMDAERAAGVTNEELLERYGDHQARP